MNRFLILALCGIAAVTATLLWLSSPIVRLAFQHGAFSGRDTGEVALVQSLSLIQLPFGVGIAFLTGVVASVKVNQILIPISAFGLLLNAGLNVFVLLLITVTRLLRS